MKLKTTYWTWGTVAALTLAVAAQAADSVRLTSKPGSKVRIDGDSSIHEWKAEGAIIKGSFEVEPEFLTDKSLKSVKSLNTAGACPKAEISIPIRSLKSGNEKMNEIMQEAMKAAEHKDIVYKLTSMVVKGEVPAAGTPVKFDTKGDLTISGVTQPCELEITMERLDDGKVKFMGEKKLKMTDFKIAPPSPQIPGMDRITTKDDIAIKFEWLTAPAK